MREVFLIIVGLFVVYLGARLASIAFYRSRAEYDRLQRRLSSNGEPNGKK